MIPVIRSFARKVRRRFGFGPTPPSAPSASATSQKPERPKVEWRYDTDRGGFEGRERILRELLALFPAGRLLDLACGNGRFLRQVMAAFPRIPATGLDLSPAYCAEARSRLADWRQVEIVNGAVSMVEMALKELKEKEVIEFDAERKASMVSNLLVVLCGESDVSPVINTGTLYH